jgi:predicted AAA+ superfamily ATPase
MLKDEIKNIVQSQLNWLEPEPDEILRIALDSFPELTSFTYILTGVRRSGKSTLMKQLMRKSGRRNFISFEDPRTFDFKVDDFFKLEEVFEELNGDTEKFFFDEIQNISAWERYVRLATDQKKIIVITGSNASLLSKELGTRLTGRHLDFEVFPFSYKEFLLFRGLNFSADSFHEYLIQGGFPEYLKKKRGEVLSTLVNDILDRDIFIRHALKNTETYRHITRYLLSNISKEISFNNIKNTFHLGSATSAMDFLGYLNDAYLFFLVPRFDYSLKVQSVNPKKVYGIDTGLINVNSLSITADKGRLLENYVFLEIRKQSRQVFYFRKKGECDFITRSSNGTFSAIQVSWQVSSENEKREVEGLLEAMNYLNLNDGLIITFNQEDQISINGKTIRLTPAWKMSSIGEELIIK